MKRRLTRRTCAIALLYSAILLGLPSIALIFHHQGTAKVAQAQDMTGMAMPAMTMADLITHWAQTAGAFHSDGVTRTYYISADEVVWDYAPDGRNEITGKPFDRVADTYVASGVGRIGSRYVKCLYRGYTDAHLPAPAEAARRRGLPRASSAR